MKSVNVCFVAQKCVLVDLPRAKTIKCVLLDHVGSVWMFALRVLALHWIEYQYHMTLVLRLNVNISVWMFSYSEHKLDIEIEYQMLFGWSK